MKHEVVIAAEFDAWGEIDINVFCNTCREYIELHNYEFRFDDAAAKVALHRAKP